MRTLGIADDLAEDIYQMTFRGCLIRNCYCFAIALAGLLLSPSISAATDVIDFESIKEGSALGTVTTPANAVTFGVGPSGPTSPAYVAGVGLPMTAS
jgi:hypothetical protein